MPCPSCHCQFSAVSRCDVCGHVHTSAPSQGKRDYSDPCSDRPQVPFYLYNPPAPPASNFWVRASREEDARLEKALEEKLEGPLHPKREKEPETTVDPTSEARKRPETTVDPLYNLRIGCCVIL